MDMLTDSLTTILEHPHLKKGYLELKNYLQIKGRLEDAAAIEYLIKNKFSDVNDTDSDQK